MDWTQQMEEMSQQWVDTQKKLWLNWNEVAKQASTNVQKKAMWQQMVDAWKNSLARTVDMQVESARLWSESMAASDAPESVVQWAEQFYQMTKQSTAIQKQLWDGWFQMLEKVDPVQLSNMMEMGNQPMSLWQEMSQQAMTMQQQWQQEWMKTWNAWQPGKGK